MVRKRLLVLIAALGLALAAVPAVAQAQLNTTIQSVELLNPFQVQVTGTLTCPDSGSYSVSTSVAQVGPQRSLRGGGGGTYETCGANEVVSWTTLNSPGPFKAGSADVFANGNFCDYSYLNCESDQAHSSVKLKK